MIHHHIVRSCIVCLCVLASGAASLDAGSAFPRVRPVGAALADVLARGCARSPTLASLVAEIERSDVIVHIETRWVPRDPVAETRFIARAGRDRYLRIFVAADLPEDTAVALLGHELQHAREIAQASWVTDDSRVAELYGAIGYRVGGMDRSVVRVDSDAGHQVEAQVRSELRGAVAAHARRVPRSGRGGASPLSAAD